jgi:hypothetical protein
MKTKAKLRTYRIVFVAHGCVDIEARTEEEAEAKFNEKELGAPDVNLVEVTSDSIEDVTDAMSALNRGIKL